MVIVIDAYNLLKQIFDDPIVQQDRERYINTLKRYAKKKQHTIILVFDGGFSDWQSREKHGNVIVIYSGTRDSADEVIKRYLEENKDKDLLLVTADRQIIDHAAHFQIVSIDPLVFDNYVKQALGKLAASQVVAQSEAKKIHHDQDDELDALMEQASMVIEQKPEEDLRTKSMQRRKDFVLSKKKRKVMAKLKKL